MPKKSKLAEAHQRTMEKAPTFKIWVKRHLQDKSNIAKYERAYNSIHGIGNEKANVGDESSNSDV